MKNLHTLEKSPYWKNQEGFSILKEEIEVWLEKDLKHGWRCAKMGLVLYAIVETCAL